jgi:hypothetical protein
MASGAVRKGRPAMSLSPWVLWCSSPNGVCVVFKNPRDRDPFKTLFPFDK